MNPIFAQAATQEVTFRDIGLVVCVLMLILLVVAQVMQLVDRNKKQPREVTFAGEPVDRKDFDAHVKRNQEEHDNLFKKLGGAERGIEERLRSEMRRTEEAAKESRKNLHEELTVVRENVAKLSANTETLDQRTVRIEEKLDEFIQRAR